ncbi:hypothetical protein D3C87_1739870 [compost metagenome]
MHPELDRGAFCFRLLLDIHEINTERGRQCGKGRVGAGISSRRNAQKESNTDNQSQVVQRQHRIEIIRFGRRGYALRLSIYVEQCSERQKKEVYDHQHYHKPEHILLRFTDVFAG